MSKNIITEDQLRERLRRSGKTDEEIEKLIDQYVEVSSEKYFDRKAISEILKKSKEESMLRVGRFNLTREQYDALLSYFEESGELVSSQQIDAKSLVQKALGEFINLLS